MAAYSSAPAWRIPGRGAWWAAVCGVAQSRTRGSDLAAAAVCVCVCESGCPLLHRGRLRRGRGQDGEPREGHCTNCFSFPFSGEPRGARAHVRGTHLLIPDVSWEPGEVGTHRQTAGSPCGRSDLGP